MKQKYLEAGRIVNTFGIRGEVKLDPWCDSPAFLQGVRTLYIDGVPRRVASARVHKGMLILRFEGVEDVNAAMALKNKLVLFDRADAALPGDRVFVADLLGAAVVDESGRELGKLAEVVELPRGSVFVVRGPDGEHSIPAVPEFVRSADADAGLIRVHLIEGM